MSDPARANVPTPSPEVRALVTKFVRIQRAKYGEDWPKHLAREMAEETAPVIRALFMLARRG